MQENKDATFILYQNNQANVVSKEEWERNWFKWWKRINSDKKK